MKTVAIYTDGACSGNPGPGGWGAVLCYNRTEKELSGGAARTNGMRYVTVSSSFEFYRNTEDNHLIAEGRIKNRGKTICVAEVEIHDGSGKLLCGGTFTLFCTGKLDELSEE